jgi:ribosomal protein S18 acetylase RimI-like enzyme
MLAIELVETSPTDADAVALLHELSARLQAITGDGGSSNFNVVSVQSDDARFVVAYLDGRAAGCGALRPLAPDICEIKRMYARTSGQGIGRLILQRLEQLAAALGYREVWLETRRVNTAAVSFYLRHGYAVRANYGVYVGRLDAICFAKQLV